MMRENNMYFLTNEWMVKGINTNDDERKTEDDQAAAAAANIQTVKKKQEKEIIVFPDLLYFGYERSSLSFLFSLYRSY